MSNGQELSNQMTMSNILSAGNLYVNMKMNSKLADLNKSNEKMQEELHAQTQEIKEQTEKLGEIKDELSNQTLELEEQTRVQKEDLKIQKENSSRPTSASAPASGTNYKVV